MSNYFHCELCDKSNKIRSKKKHLNSQYHKSLTKSIIRKYTVENPSFLHIEDTLKNFVDEYNKKFELYSILCKWKLNFSGTIIFTKSMRLYNIHRAGWNLRTNLMSKIEYFESDEHKFSHISEMIVVFITDLGNITYELYLKIPKPMIKWILNAILAKNPEDTKKIQIQLSSIN